MVSPDHDITAGALSLSNDLISLVHLVDNLRGYNRVTRVPWQRAASTSVWLADIVAVACSWTVHRSGLLRWMLLSLAKVIRLIDAICAVVHKQIRVTNERVACCAIWAIHETCILLHFWSIQPMEARDSIIDLPNIDTFKVVILAWLAKTALVDAAYINIAKLPVDRLNEAELAPVVHLHGVLLRAIHHGIVSRSIYDLMVGHNSDLSPRIYRSQPWAHTHHHFRRLWAGIYWIILGGWGFDIRGSRVLSRDLAWLTDTYALTLAGYLHVGVCLTSNDNVVLDELDCVILAVIDVLRGESPKLLWVQYLVILHWGFFRILAWCFQVPVIQTIMPDLIAVLGVLINLQVTDLNESLILTSIYTADVDCGSIGVFRANIIKAILATGSFGDVYRVFVTFLFLIRVINAWFRLVNRFVTPTIFLLLVKIIVGVCFSLFFRIAIVFRQI